MLGAAIMNELTRTTSNERLTKTKRMTAIGFTGEFFGIFASAGSQPCMYLSKNSLGFNNSPQEQVC